MNFPSSKDSPQKEQAPQESRESLRIQELSLENFRLSQELSAFKEQKVTIGEMQAELFSRRAQGREAFHLLSLIEISLQRDNPQSAVLPLIRSFLAHVNGENKNRLQKGESLSLEATEDVDVSASSGKRELLDTEKQSVKF